MVMTPPPAMVVEAFGSRSSSIVRLLESARFDEALPALLECRETELSANPEAATSCGLAMAGILRSQGRTSEWAEGLLWFRERGLPASGTAEESSFYMARYDGLIDLRSAAAGKPTGVLIPAGPIVMPTPTNTNELDGLDVDNHYLLSVQAQATQVAAIVDTGSIDLLHMSADTAERLGIVDVVGETSPKSRPFSGVTPDGPDQYRIAQSLRIGAVDYSNVLVRVDLDNRIKSTIVGMGFLSRFKSVRFSRNRLTFNQDHSNADCDRVSFRFAASPYLTSSSLVFDAMYNGEPHSAVLDTGMAATLGFVNPLAQSLVVAGLPEFTPRVPDGDASPFKVSSQKVQVGSVEISDANSLLFHKSDASGYQIVIGGGAKKAVDVYLDFQRGCFCFLPPE